MSTLFTRIINGELPGRFVYTDDTVVAFLTIAPLTPGHALVVPRQEIDQWTDAPEPLLHHCLDVARRIGNAAKQAFGAPRAGVVIAGLEVPHMHIHVPSLDPRRLQLRPRQAGLRPRTGPGRRPAPRGARAQLT
jgi:diadenosine tetraphosphate (Ap4A) HIT family hydrolase